KTRSYLEDAIKRGAKAVLISKKNLSLPVPKDFTTVLVSESDPAYFHGPLASCLKGHPSQQLQIVAITGTNGKTSMTYILSDLFSRAGLEYGIIGTIQVIYGNRVLHTGYTTPGPSELQSILKNMLDAGVKYVFMEASSHGLKLNRMNGIHLKAAIFTNLTRDHLDFHENMEDYLNSKYKLFKLLSNSYHEERLALISTDTKGGRDILAKIKKEKLPLKTLAFGKGKDYEGEVKSLSLNGTEFFLKPKKGSPIDLQTNLLGNFNFLNVSMSYIAALHLGLEEELIQDSIKNLHPVDGRFQIVYNRRRNRLAVVDYAHTPDALLNVLKSLKEIPHSRLICLFGCGGDRDHTKRPIMGKIAAENSDMVILTSDNPRTEDPEKIIDEIEAGFPKGFTSYIRQSNRRQAILKGIQVLPEEGFLLVAGKGHENYQIIGSSKENFSDTIEIQNAFELDEESRR
ncbi:MAG: UDP-N-acetylmuramoyl-L-alanyl-D-glutamate--2,6-diaminopimelate ligase, partial [Leptospiraceae bacterium]|nr:UDP-N-acetylmuramoyl-L-alanyl-D-glutamate--2,6-diaminopimelate ligase [Leptospiraceae bacterium]